MNSLFSNHFTMSFIYYLIDLVVIVVLDSKTKNQNGMKRKKTIEQGNNKPIVASQVKSASTVTPHPKSHSIQPSGDMTV